MDDKTVLYFGALLHDIGKVIYRGSSGKGTHSSLGAQFISDDVSPLNDCFCSAEGRGIVRAQMFKDRERLAVAHNVQPLGHVGDINVALDDHLFRR